MKLSTTLPAGTIRIMRVELAAHGMNTRNYSGGEVRKAYRTLFGSETVKVVI